MLDQAYLRIDRLSFDIQLMLLPNQTKRKYRYTLLELNQIIMMISSPHCVLVNFLVETTLGGRHLLQWQQLLVLLLHHHCSVDERDVIVVEYAAFVAAYVGASGAFAHQCR
jgi:hypothetical protein